MGQDKAFLDIEGVSLIERVRRALCDAKQRITVGGDRARLQAPGWEWVADQWPGEGPLGGMVTALEVARHDVVVVLACDHPEISTALSLRLVDALVETGGHAAIAVVDVHVQPLVAAYHRDALPVLRQAFAAGERSPRRAMALLQGVASVEVDATAVLDLDSPDDVRAFERRPR